MPDLTPAQIQDNCAAGEKCECVDCLKPWQCPNWGRSSLPAPPIVTSKEERLRTTRKAWEGRRDKMMREAERRFEKLKPGSDTEERLHEIRSNPEKHLRKKGHQLGKRSMKS